MTWDPFCYSTMVDRMTFRSP